MNKQPQQISFKHNTPMTWSNLTGFGILDTMGSKPLLFFPSTKINATDPGTPRPYSEQARKK